MKFKEFIPTKNSVPHRKYFKATQDFGRNVLTFIIQFNLETREVESFVSSDGPAIWLGLSWKEAERMVGQRQRYLRR